MKKVFNILGYISILIIPFIILYSIFSFRLEFKILAVFVLIGIIVINIIHYIKTKIKYIGIRIIISILLFSSIMLILINIHGYIKSVQGNQLLSKIERIEYIGFEDGVLTKEQLNSLKLEFVKDNFILIKGASDGIVYYIDGTSDKIEVNYPSGVTSVTQTILVINGDEYYIKHK